MPHSAPQANKNTPGSSKFYGALIGLARIAQHAPKIERVEPPLGRSQLALGRDVEHQLQSELVVQEKMAVEIPHARIRRDETQN